MSEMKNGVCEYGVCEHGVCEYGVCEYGVCEYGVCEHVWVLPSTPLFGVSLLPP